MANVDLKNYICTIPFQELEIHRHAYFFCCASWLKKVVKTEDYEVKDVWNSDVANDIRNSILDGSYKYCDKEQCPNLSRLLNIGEPPNPGPILPVGKFNTKNKKYPILVNYNVDRTCNFKCPSCRTEMIVSNSIEKDAIKKMLDDIDDAFAEHMKIMYISGAGDPFASPSYRDYLRNFDPNKFKNLRSIFIHSNASLWDKKMWDTMPNIHNYVKACEISIDAGTKETYENITRLNGKWEVLIDNLKFISTLKGIHTIRVSFVVQKANYKEMNIFVDLIQSIFGNRAEIFFGKINNWATYTEEEFKDVKIWDAEHPEHLQFIDEFNKVCYRYGVSTNMYEFAVPIKNKRLI